MIYLGQQTPVSTACNIFPVCPRVLRRYAKFADRFLRVAFADEKLDRMPHTELSEPIVGRVLHTTSNGLRIDGRTYTFLAFSNSQLREHSCWMYSDPTEEELHAHAASPIPTAADIRWGAGVLDQILTPAKWAARLGQCFSSTSQTTVIAEHEVYPFIGPADSLARTALYGAFWRPGVMIVERYRLQHAAQSERTSSCM